MGQVKFVTPEQKQAEAEAKRQELENDPFLVELGKATTIAQIRTALLREERRKRGLPDI